MRVVENRSVAFDAHLLRYVGRKGIWYEKLGGHQMVAKCAIWGSEVPDAFIVGFDSWVSVCWNFYHLLRGCAYEAAHVPIFVVAQQRGTSKSKRVAQRLIGRKGKENDVMA